MDLFFKKINKALNINNIFVNSVFIKGILMGITDLIPGVSGSTIAIILGIYDQFLKSIKTINFKALFNFEIKNFLKTSEIKFLFKIFSGMFFSFIVFAKIFNFLLSKPFSRQLLFSFFLGLVLALIIDLCKEIKISFTRVLLIMLGSIFSFLISYFNNCFFDVAFYLPIKLILSGFIAIFFMLLPGISGSFIFVLLGVYPIVINALSDVLNFENVQILFFLSLGIFIGFLIFSRIILFFLNKFYFSMMSFLIGLMLGSIYAIWPFYTYTQKFMQNNFFLVNDKITMPELFSFQFIFYFTFILLGFFIFFKIKQQSKEKKI